ncbi:MAG: B-box zinc finger protein [Terracidiphilus sp.]
MDCVNHMGVPAAAYCQNCGKALCADCVAAGAMRSGTGGQILCDACTTAWQSYQQPFVAPPSRGPNPSAAAVLGLIPGVGAMYNGQFFKGFIHVVVFAVLIGITENYPIFGLFIAAWILYQSFEAFHTAEALRDGQPVPDPFGLNELGNWMNLGARMRPPTQPGAGQAPAGAGFQAPGPAGQAPAGPEAGGAYPPPAGEPEPSYQAPYQTPIQGPNQVPYVPPPFPWPSNAPVGAFVLIGLGMLFLLGQMKYAFPLLLIGLGVWLIIRHIGDSQGGSK